MNDMAGCAARDQLPHAFMTVIDKEFSDKFNAPDSDSRRDIACYIPSDERRGGGS